MGDYIVHAEDLAKQSNLVDSRYGIYCHPSTSGPTSSLKSQQVHSIHEEVHAI